MRKIYIINDCATSHKISLALVLRLVLEFWKMEFWKGRQNTSILFNRKRERAVLAFLDSPRMCRLNTPCAMSVSNNSSLIWDVVFYLSHRLLLDHLQLRLEVVLEASVMYKYPTMSLIGESKEIKHPHTETVKCNCSSEIHRGKLREELRSFSDTEGPWNSGPSWRSSGPGA